MGGSQKPKRITWASDVNLCQVRLFLSEESPSQVGKATQDHLQAKTLWHSQTGGMGSDENLPPGFEGIQPADPWIAKLSQIPLAKWKCPPRFRVNIDWRVVAGDESREAETQNEREMRALEAIYPRPSAIPQNPSALVEEDSTYNDMYTPVVPITPIEDEDAAATAQDSSFGATSANTRTPSGVEPDIVAAAQSALTGMSNGGDQGNLIDRDLLLKILSDPKMIQQLVTNASSSSAPSAPSSSLSSSFHSMPAVSSATQHNLPNIPNMPPLSGMHNNLPSTSTQYIPSLTSFGRPEFVPPPRALPAGPFYPPGRVGPIQVSAPPPPSVGPPVAKDINYYKSLIQQHGGERRDVVPQQFGHQSNQGPPPPMMTNQEASNMMMKPKVMKPCIYFNSSRGCRNGANCTFQHDMSSSQQRVSGIPEVQSAKRVKLDREITGT